MTALLATGGALMGGGIWVIIRGCTRRHVPSLGKSVSEFALQDAGPMPVGEGLISRRPGASQGRGVSSGEALDSQTLRSRALGWSETAVSALGADFRKITRDLRICGISTAEHAFAKISASLFWGFLPVLLILAANFVGWTLPYWWGIAGIFLGSAGGFVLADRQLREKAAKRRVVFRGALVAYLDLVKILLAGGSHTDGALYQAALAGKGWAFSEIRGVLDWSRVHGQPLSVGLARLGGELGVTELNEIASTVNLAETEGASPSEALARKAESAAERALTEAQAEANALTEKMTVPTVVIAFAFVVFIAYPALSSLSSAL